MSEVLAQLKKKGGSGEMYVADYTSLVNGTPKTLTLEKSAPNIKKMVAVVLGTGTLNSVGEFDVENTTITQKSYFGNNWYPTYYQLTLNGNQLTVKQIFTSGTARIIIYYA